MTNTRERFTNEFILTFSDNEDTFFDRVMDFIETIEREAEARGREERTTVLTEAAFEKGRVFGREEMKKEILKIIPLETPKSNGNTMNENDIIERENLLLWQIKFGISSL